MPSTYNFIASQTISGSSTTSITFNNIPQNYTDLVISCYVNCATNDNSLAYQFNGDTTGNYSFIFSQGDGSSVAAAAYVGQTSSQFGLITNASWGTTISNIQDYSNSNTFKPIYSKAGLAGFLRLYSGTWKNTAPITSITILGSPNGYAFTANSKFTIYGISSEKSPKAEGGTITTDGTYWYHKFTSSGVFTASNTLSCDFLVVAGGGGSVATDRSGGGGAGGYRTSVGTSGGGSSSETQLFLSPNISYAVTVGAGGAIGASGSNSVLSTITSIGGGVGAYNNGAGATGGSGGGAGRDTGTTPGSGTTGQGYAGGNCSTDSATFASSGGGGGAGSVGGNGSGPRSGGKGGNGGAGITSSISGTSVSYAGGGGGSSDASGGNGTASAGGGAGGNNAGTSNTGGGAGGGGVGGAGTGAAGGSGIVIVRYPV